MSEQQELMITEQQAIVNKLLQFGFNQQQIRLAIQEYGVKFNKEIEYK